jgi:hypothetical protein
MNDIINKIKSELDEIEDMISDLHNRQNIHNTQNSSSYDDKKLSEIEAILLDIKSDLLNNGNG